MPKHILDIGRPKRKEGGRSSGAGDRRSSIDKPLSSKQEQPDASKSSTGADEDETSQESQSVDVSGSGAPMAESSSDQADSMVWHPSDNSSTNAVPASESGSERNVSKEHTEVSVSHARNVWVLNIYILADDTPSPNNLSNIYCFINDILSTNHLSNSYSLVDVSSNHHPNVYCLVALTLSPSHFSNIHCTVDTSVTFQTLTAWLIMLNLPVTFQTLTAW